MINLKIEFGYKISICYRVEKIHEKLLQGCPVADHAGYMLTVAYVQINICFALSSTGPEFSQPEFNIILKCSMSSVVRNTCR
jgi:hypothetical protein